MRKDERKGKRERNKERREGGVNGEEGKEDSGEEDRCRETKLRKMEGKQRGEEEKCE